MIEVVLQSLGIGFAVSANQRLKEKHCIPAAANQCYWKQPLVVKVLPSPEFCAASFNVQSTAHEDSAKCQIRVSASGGSTWKRQPPQAVLQSAHSAPATPPSHPTNGRSIEISTPGVAPCTDSPRRVMTASHCFLKEEIEAGYKRASKDREPKIASVTAMIPGSSIRPCWRRANLAVLGSRIFTKSDGES